MHCVTRCNRRDTEDSFSETYRRCTDEGRIRTVTLDFGQVAVDEKVFKAVKICNGSSNEEIYEVRRDPITNPLDAVFQFHKNSWTVAPNSTIVFQVHYSPVLPSQKSVDYFTIVNCDRPILRLIVRGESIGPNVVFSPEKLVMICPSGGSVKKRVKMTNYADAPAFFMFDVDERQSSCKADPAEGRVNAHSHVFVVITFTPTFDGLQALYLPCLIQHQAPIMMQIYAYCGNEYTKENQFHIPILIYPHQTNNAFVNYMSDCNRIELESANLSVYPLSLSKNYLDFGRVDADPLNSTLRPPQATCFTNHSQTDMLVKWDEDIDGIFEVKPKNVRVKAGETYLFEIRFNPNAENVFHSRELTALVFWINTDKSGPNYRYSMLASVRAMGHTFPLGSPNWIPQYQIPQTVIMPACLPSRPAYATFFIRRLGHRPLMFRFIPPDKTNFTVKPMLGVIYKDYQVIIVRMFPGKLDRELLYERWAIRLNENADYEVCIDFRGYAEYPCLSFSDDVVEFPSTHPGAEQAKSVFVRNTSRHNITYRYQDIPSVLDVDQVQGQLSANEILVHNWIFRPVEEGDYKFDVTCCFVASTGSLDDETVLEDRVHVTGKSERGYIVAMPSELNFGEQTYNETRKLNFQLINPSPVEMSYTLTLKDNIWPYEEKRIQRNVLIEPTSGTLGPGDSMKTEVSVTPRERGFHEITIQYFVQPSPRTGDLSPINDPTDILRIKYSCILPTINVEELLYHRVSPIMSKYVLWRLLNIKKLNAILNDLQPGEKEELDMNFPPTVLQNEAIIVKLLINNPTSTPATWSLKRVKLRSCSKSKDKRGSNSQHLRLNYPHRDLCDINPKSGTLKPRENVVVTMELRCAIIGEANLNWNLDIGHDRRVCLSIKMICLSDGEPKAFPLYGSQLQLKKIYIGDRDPINQICWIYNPTKKDVAYSLDTATLEKFNEDNRSETLSCSNPTGTVQAQSCEPILIKFRPRKWGTFDVVVPLILGNETTAITIRGETTNDTAFRLSDEKSSFRDAFHVPEAPVYFNTDLITLQPIPMHSRVTRMIMIHNNLEHEIIAYKWKKFEIPGIIEISVEPQSGRIQPESLQTCRIIVVTGGKPCKLNADVACEFINQSEKRVHDKKILLQNRIREEMKDYFTITEKGTVVPEPEQLILEGPKPFHKALTVRCYIYSPQDEQLKMYRSERLKQTPEIEICDDKKTVEILASKETIALSKFILEGMIWDILQTMNMCESSASSVRYSQIAMKPLQRKILQDRSYVSPSGRMLERLLENMIFMIVHKEFAMDVIHLTHPTDARQATYPKMWQQVPKPKGLEQSPEI